MTWLRCDHRGAGFPRPVAQVPIRQAGREVYRLDLGDPARRVGFEYDDEEFHGSNEAVREDETRRRRLRQSCSG